MTPDVAGAVGLYPRLLGPAWDAVDVAVRELHGGSPVRAAGVFRVRRGAGLMARLIAWAARFPAAGDAVAVRLIVTPSTSDEVWHRTFDGRPMVSQQWARPDGLLAERVGAVEIRFRLAVEGGAIVFRVARVALRLGPLAVPLPRWLAPRVSARVGGAAGGGTETLVEISAPLAGAVVSYAGTMTRADD